MAAGITNEDSGVSVFSESITRYWGAEAGGQEKEGRAGQRCTQCSGYSVKSVVSGNEDTSFF